MGDDGDDEEERRGPFLPVDENGSDPIASLARGPYKCTETETQTQREREEKREREREREMCVHIYICMYRHTYMHTHVIHICTHFCK